MLFNVRPAGHRLLVRTKVGDGKTKGGIYLPEQAKEDLAYADELGEVVAIGPTAFETNGLGGAEVWDVKEGDFILYSRHGGKVIKHPDFAKAEDGYIYRVINDEDVVAHAWFEEVSNG